MSNGTKPTNFSAADSALGYLYQVRLALLSSLQRLAEDHALALDLETLDDVVFDSAGSALELLQLKHHRERAANLTTQARTCGSRSVSGEGRGCGTIPVDARLFLNTTSDVGPGSAASKLLARDRDEAEALKRLTHTSTTSTSDTNRPAYAPQNSDLGLVGRSAQQRPPLSRYRALLWWVATPYLFRATLPVNQQRPCPA